MHIMSGFVLDIFSEYNYTHMYQNIQNTKTGDVFAQIHLHVWLLQHHSQIAIFMQDIKVIPC